MLSVSVVITTFSRPQLAVRALRSVLDQSRVPEQILVVDDHSPEWPNAELDALAALNPAVTVLRMGRRGGPQVARNRGAEEAAGDILMFLDDDDRWGPEKVALQARLLEENPDLGWVYTGMIAMDDRTGADREINRSVHHVEGRVWPAILYRNFIGPTSAVAMRRTLFSSVGGFDTSLPAMQDFDLWVRLASAAPVAYDGQHNLYFSTKSDVSHRVSSAPEKYQGAVESLLKKYESEFADRPDVRRRALSGFHILLASKHTDVGNYPQAVLSMARAAYFDLDALKRLATWTGRRIGASLKRRTAKPSAMQGDQADLS